MSAALFEPQGAERRGATRSGGGGGIPAVEPELDAEALAVLRERIGELEPWPLARELEEFELPAARAAAARRWSRRSGRRASSPSTRTGCATRPGAATSTWRGCAAAALEAAPDAVVMPADAEALRRVLDVCAAEGIAVVPFGGGTSVVGGVEPLRGAHERLISLDLGALRDVEVDRRSLTARLGAGLRGPEAEAALGREGLTLGHFPQSFEYATIGGFAATRSRRPGLERLRALRRPGQLGAPARPGRGHADAGDAAHRRRARRCGS